MSNREVIGMVGCTHQGGPQWVLSVERDPANPGILTSARFENPVRKEGPCCKAGDPSFYSVEASAQTLFGAPVVVQEPAYAIPAPAGVEYRRPKRDKGKFLEWEVIASPGLVIGLVLRDGLDQALKTSFSGLRVFKGTMHPVSSDDGTLEHDGKTWHLQRLVNADYERFDKTRFAAIFGLEKPDFVQVVDLFDVA